MMNEQNEGGGEEFLDAVEEEHRHAMATEEEEDDNASAHSSLSSGSSSSSLPEQPRERDHHSYLPGPSHPLLHSAHGNNIHIRQHSHHHHRQHRNNNEENGDDGSGDPNNNDSPQEDPDERSLLLSTTTIPPPPPQQSSSSSSSHKELAILELPGLVLFPGATIPIRLRNRSWIQHLGRQIDASRKVGSPDFGRTVQLGVLVRDTVAVETRARRENARRRSSLLRQGVRTERPQQRLSRILLQELAESIMDSTSEEEEEEEEDGPRPRRRQSRAPQHPFIGRVGTIATVTYTHGDALLDDSTSTTASRTNGSNQHHNGHGARASRSSQVWQQHAEQQGELILQAVGTTRFRVQSYIDFQSFADVQVFQVEEFQQDQHPLTCPTSTIHNVIRRKIPVDPALFDTDGDKVNMDDSTSNHQQRRRSSKMARIQHPSGQLTINAKYFASHQESLLRRLSIVTPTPYMALRQTWPWKLVAQLVTTIQTEANNRHASSSSSLVASLSDLLQEPETAPLLDHPTAFSFWLASQMPLSVQDKYQLLRLDTTVERLTKLQQHLLDYTSRPTIAICCRSCHIPLSTVDCVFTVGGAEGTTGNYVNEHGFIHQVVTLRTVEDEQRKLYVSGQASTDNSYFPGYSWSVTYCTRCGCLLGWKFHWVGLDNDDDYDVDIAMESEDNATMTTAGRSRRRRSSRRHSESTNRPASFYGFMSSSLITDQAIDDHDLS